MSSKLGVDGSFIDISVLRADYHGKWVNHEITEIEEEEEDYASELFDDNNNNIKVFKPMASIKEEDVESTLSESPSFDGRRLGANVVYVVVRKKSLEPSMEALKWVLTHTAISSYTTVMLVYVFPETNFIPSPLGYLPISKVNPEQKEIYMAQESYKRRQLLQQYLNVCSKSQVKVDKIEVESDNEAKAILDLIPILNIKKLVLGIKKSNARWLRSKKDKGVTEEILQNAAEFCDVKIICEGKEISDPKKMDISSPSSSPGAAKCHEANVNLYLNAISQ